MRNSERALTMAKKLRAAAADGRWRGDRRVALLMRIKETRRPPAMMSTERGFGS